MSGYNNNYSNYDGDDDRHDNSGSGLRSMLEQVLEENRSLRKLLEGDKREQTVTDLLKSKGIDPLIAEIIPKDEEPKAWIEKYAHLLGAKSQELLEDAPAGEPKVTQVVQDDPAVLAEQEALAAMQDAEESGSPASVRPELLNEMDKIQTEEELLKFFERNGAPGTF